MKKRKTSYASLRMIFIITTFLFGILAGQSMIAQTGKTNQQPIKKLANWEGEWQGEGWSMDETQQKMAFTVNENIQIKIGGNAILAEGIGKDKLTGKIGFESLGVIYFDIALQKYQMKSFTAKGDMALANAIVNEKGEFIWEFEVPNGKVRYTTLVKDDVWTEVGEYVMPGGQTFPILEMKLKRVKSN
jgi:hypothetical protein